MATENVENLASSDEKHEFQASTFSVSLRSLAENIFFYWPWVVISVLIALAIAWWYLRQTPNVYQTEASVLIKDGGKTGGKSQSPLTSWPFSSVVSVANNLDTELQILSSRNLLKKVVEDLGLYTNLKRVDTFCPQDLYGISPIKMVTTPQEADKIRYASLKLDLKKNGALTVTGTVGGEEVNKSFNKLPAFLTTRKGTIYFSRVDSVPLVSDMEIEGTVTSLAGAVGTYKGRMSVVQKNKAAYIATLTANDVNTLRSADFMSKVVEKYNEDANLDKNEVAERTAEFIDNRIALISKELSGTENSIAGFKRAAGITDVVSNAEAAFSGKTLAEKQLSENEAQLQLIRYLKDYIQKVGSKNEVYPSGIVLNSDQGLTDMISTYNEKVLERKRLMKSSSENSPAVVEMETDLQNMRRAIASGLQSVEKTVQIARNQLMLEHGRYAQKVSDNPEDEKEFLSISRQHDFQAQLYLLLMQKREENALQLAATANNGRIVEEPQVVGIVSPQRTNIYLIALGIGFGLPLLFIYLKLLFAVKIMGRDDLAKLTDLPVIGDIPLDKGNSGQRRIVVHENTNEMMDESFRNLRTNIQFLLGNQAQHKVIMFTSALSGEGKSTIAANLASSYSFLGKKVIIVGLDIRRPGLNKVFSLSTRAEGISQFLADPEGTDLLSLIQDSEVSKNLFVLPGGVVPPNPTELLSQPSLDKAIEILKENFDYIILDTAPVGLVSDSQVISRVADVTIAVVRAGFSYKNSVLMLTDMAKEGLLPKLSFVLNAVDTESRRNQYGYSYGYGRYKSYGYTRYGYSHYGYGYGSTKEKKGLWAKIKSWF